MGKTSNWDHVLGTAMFAVMVLLHSRLPFVAKHPRVFKLFEVFLSFFFKIANSYGKT